jgi:hypothetical protein
MARASSENATSAEEHIAKSAILRASLNLQVRPSRHRSGPAWARLGFQSVQGTERIVAYGCRATDRLIDLGSWEMLGRVRHFSTIAQR